MSAALAFLRRSLPVARGPVEAHEMSAVDAPVVEVDPVAWFTLPDGTVSDLSAFDFETTQEVIELEAKMADGFTKIDVDG